MNINLRARSNYRCYHYYISLPFSQNAKYNYEISSWHLDDVQFDKQYEIGSRTATTSTL